MQIPSLSAYATMLPLNPADLQPLARREHLEWGWDPTETVCQNSEGSETGGNGLSLAPQSRDPWTEAVLGCYRRILGSTRGRPTALVDVQVAEARESSGVAVVAVVEELLAGPRKLLRHVAFRVARREGRWSVVGLEGERRSPLRVATQRVWYRLTGQVPQKSLSRGLGAFLWQLSRLERDPRAVFFLAGSLPCQLAWLRLALEPLRPPASPVRIENVVPRPALGPWLIWEN